ncbi:hypothetical protein QAD02_002402 [Eretmocerus hayati]|uniref:Uncharacterized protein n=1 Tax=Eretmocerus hayati TaxID=131215 RepID=A0ACC2NJQ8_9HYME|nr:hypothetical protein QAD02_002402 [Eretmocerus hayati]
MRKGSALTGFEQEQEDGWRGPNEGERNDNRGRRWNRSRRDSGKSREPQKGKSGRYTRDLWAHESMASNDTDEECDGVSRRRSYWEAEEERNRSEQNRSEQSERGNRNGEHKGQSPR